MTAVGHELKEGGLDDSLLSSTNAVVSTSGVLLAALDFLALVQGRATVSRSLAALFVCVARNIKRGSERECRLKGKVD